MSTDPLEISDLLRRWSGGDRQALDRLIPLVYDRLRAIAHHRLRAEGDHHSLDTTGLVHEAYLRLVEGSPDVEDRERFLSLASRVMRNVLVDQARARKAAKRGGGIVPLELHAEEAGATELDLAGVLELDEALHRLEEMNARQTRILEHRYFGGLSLEEIAAVLGISPATVKRELRSARAWLALVLGAEGPAA